MYIRVLDPLELRNDSRKESIYENKRSMNYREAEYLFPDGEGMVTSSTSNVSTLRNVEVNRLVARKHLESSNHLCSYAEEGFKKAFKVYNKVVTFMTFYFMIVTNVLKGITSFVRCERKNTVGNSKSLSESKSLRDGEGYSFSTFLECLGDILGYKQELWLYSIIYALWRKYKLFRNENKEIWKFVNTLTFRLVIAMPWLRNLLLGNVFRETFNIRSGNVGKTFLAGKCFRACLCLYSDLWASCRYYLYIYTVILEFHGKFRRFYEYIYLYIYDSCRLRLSCKWASYPLAFAVKTYTLVYFSSKASLLMIKSHNKYQSIDLIGLALVEKAYSKNRSFLSHNRSYWRELRPLVTPWTWCIKEGTEPWRGQIGFTCLMSMVSLLPFSLSSPSLALLCFCCSFIIVYYGYVQLRAYESSPPRPQPCWCFIWQHC